MGPLHAPLALFEGLVYFVTSQYGLEHLPFRLWVGLWMSIILIMVCIFNGSYLVVFITRYDISKLESYVLGVPSAQIRVVLLP